MTSAYLLYDQALSSVYINTRYIDNHSFYFTEVWLDFIPVNFTFVYQFLTMDSSENDFLKLCLLDSDILMHYIGWLGSITMAF